LASVLEGREDDHERATTESVEDADAIDPRHEEIEDHEVDGRSLSEPLKGLPAVTRRFHLVAPVREHVAGRPPHRLVVIDDEYPAALRSS
jgi:hypothetical protein